MSKRLILSGFGSSLDTFILPVGMHISSPKMFGYELTLDMFDPSLHCISLHDPFT